jgi:hypothetical protein
VLLKDPKGRGGTARDHLVPLIKMALDILEPLRAQNGPRVTSSSAPWEESPDRPKVIPNWTSHHSQIAAIGFPIGRYSRRLSDVQCLENPCIHVMPKA